MSAKRKFDPDKLIDYSQDYYAILGLAREDVPVVRVKTNDQKQDQLLVTAIVTNAYRKAVRKAHPDAGGSDEQFRLVIQAQMILEDPWLRAMSDSGGRDRLKMVEGGSAMEVDWEQLGSYRQGTEADTTGYSLFVSLCQRAESLGLVPAFFPTLETHTYEWDWAIPDKESKLAMALVYDLDDVIRLTHGDALEESLPFKIHIFIPRGALYFMRDDDEWYEYEDGTVDKVRGKLRVAEYSDHLLLETTLLAEARAFLAPGGKLDWNLALFRDGKLQEAQAQLDRKNKQQKWVSTKQMKEIDTDAIKSIMRSQTFQLVPDDAGADFIEEMPAATPVKPRKAAPLPEGLIADIHQDLDFAILPAEDAE